MVIDKIILASNSPRRKELLEQLGLEFQIIPATKDEVMRGNCPSEIVGELGKMKAMEVAEKIIEEEKINLDSTILVIGADTLVVKDDKILGKPKDQEDAMKMIRFLSGSEHSVFTGVCLLCICNRKITVMDQFTEETRVSVYEMTEQEILEYVDSKEPMDKAGAYAIQGKFGRYIGTINGEYNTVVGMPIGRLWQSIKVIQER